MNKTFLINETCEGDVYTTVSVLDYNYFKNFYKLIAIGLNKQ